MASWGFKYGALPAGATPRGVRAENWWHFYSRSMPHGRGLLTASRLKAQDFGREAAHDPQGLQKMRRPEWRSRLRAGLRASSWGGKNRVVSVVDSPVSEEA